ncbi:bifunctional folylpolyglutamate synthase/dihydrofolate synthase [Granulicatella balaenopterae]|uniref:bifunctional folylpolyglutamate synthase/dihydrofolate synthase n=1 Tax=Granulicatella balaenopterae TaxID=137733 RepID=UPI0015A6F135|nr:folylpolyglutamate synthase/dihydrofolate synthase family protein [Granulicatella balaenopterae]
MEQFETISEWIKSREYLRHKNGLSRLSALMDILDNPQKTFKSIHISGTNGKGSTISFMNSLMTAHQLVVGRFVSPHLNSYHDRIAIDGIPIADSDFERIGQMIRRAEKELPTEFETLTFFEIMTAIMFVYFKEQKVDVALIEVGIGGLYDVTNIIDSDISVITSIGLDHQNLLGNTIEEIARQKAGIFKQGQTAVVGPVPAEALAIFQAIADTKNVTLYQYGNDFKMEKTRDGYLYIRSSQNLLLKKIGLIGNHQLENAALAVTAFTIFMHKYNLIVENTQIISALETTKWPGRMEQVSTNPSIWLDGCHNLPAIKRLVETIKEQTANQQQIVILFGALAKKDYREMLLLLRELLPQTEIVITTFNDSHAAGEKEFETIVKSINAIYYEDYLQYLHQFICEKNDQKVLYATGSLYFIAEIRKLLL